MLCRPVNTTYNNLLMDAQNVLVLWDVQKILVFGMKENTRRLYTNVKKLAYEYTYINIYTYYL